MEKRIAYIGLSYPLLYDYRNQASQTKNDLRSSPNPIIESPLGLMILYDELWFLCESICPNNMRKLPYVKFVDKMFVDLYYEGAESYIEHLNLKIALDRNPFYFDDIINRMGLKELGINPDGHTHGLAIGNITRAASSKEENWAYDLYILASLKERTGYNIEPITNSRYRLNEFDSSNKVAEVVEKIIIPGIPNYLHVNGPYHPCMEELRNNEYVMDFRKWIIKNHNTIQHSESDEMCLSVTQTIKETRDRVFKKYLENNNKYAFFKSTGTTMIKTGVGLACSPFSIVDAISGITINGKNVLEANNDRWQGFVMDSKDIMKANKLSL